MILNADQRERYARDGFLVIPAVKSGGAIAALRARAEAIVDAFDEREPMTIFTTGDERTKNDAYFLTSGSTIRCFFEEEAFGADGRLAVPKALSINKIGHALHDLDPVFAGFSHDPVLGSIAAGVGLERPLLYQSMYIFKQPNIGGEVRWHQDATYFVTEPVSVTAACGCSRAATARRCARFSGSVRTVRCWNAWIRRLGRSEAKRCRSKWKRVRSWSSTVICRTTAHPIARRVRGTPIRCTPSTRARAMARKIGSSASRDFRRADSIERRGAGNETVSR
jgi:hypothetical protein